MKLPCLDLLYKEDDARWQIVPKGRHLQGLHLLSVLVTQSCPSLCDPTDHSLPGSSVHRIFQASLLEWVTISFSRGPSQHRDPTGVSCIAEIYYCLSYQGTALVAQKKTSAYINIVTWMSVCKFQEESLSLLLTDWLKGLKRICSWCMVEKCKWKSLSRVQLFATPWSIQSKEFSRPEYWSG